VVVAVLAFAGLSAFDHPAGTKVWDFDTGSQVQSSAAVTHNGIVYFGADSGKLYAFYSNGQGKWEFPTQGAIVSSPSIGSDGTVYVGSADAHLYAIEPQGVERWRFNANAAILSSPAIGQGGVIYFGTKLNRFFAVRPDGTKLWDLSLEDAVIGSPAIGSDGTIYIPERRGRLHAYSAEGKHKWTFKTPKMIISSPAIGNDGTIYFGCFDGHVYAVTPGGAKKWTFATGAAVRGSAAIGPDGTIYIGSDDQQLYALAPDGFKKWTFSARANIRSTPAVAVDGTVYFGSYDHSLYALNSDGRKQWEFVTDKEITASPAIGVDGTVFFGSWNQRFYAVQGDSVLAPGSWSKFRGDAAQSASRGGGGRPAFASTDLVETETRELSLQQEAAYQARQAQMEQRVAALNQQIAQVKTVSTTSRMMPMTHRRESVVIADSSSLPAVAPAPKVVTQYVTSPRELEYQSRIAGLEQQLTSLSSKVVALESSKTAVTAASIPPAVVVPVQPAPKTVVIPTVIAPGHSGHSHPEFTTMDRPVAPIPTRVMPPSQPVVTVNSFTSSGATPMRLVNAGSPVITQSVTETIKTQPVVTVSTGFQKSSQEVVYESRIAELESQLAAARHPGEPQEFTSVVTTEETRVAREYVKGPTKDGVFVSMWKRMRNPGNVHEETVDSSAGSVTETTIESSVEEAAATSSSETFIKVSSSRSVSAEIDLSDNLAVPSVTTVPIEAEEITESATTVMVDPNLPVVDIAKLLSEADSVRPSPSDEIIARVAPKTEFDSKLDSVEERMRRMRDGLAKTRKEHADLKNNVEAAAVGDYERVGTTLADSTPAPAVGPTAAAASGGVSDAELEKRLEKLYGRKLSSLQSNLMSLNEELASARVERARMQQKLADSVKGGGGGSVAINQGVTTSTASAMGSSAKLALSANGFEPQEPRAGEQPLIGQPEWLTQDLRELNSLNPDPSLQIPPPAPVISESAQPASVPKAIAEEQVTASAPAVARKTRSGFLARTFGRVFGRRSGADEAEVVSVPSANVLSVPSAVPSLPDAVVTAPPAIASNRVNLDGSVSTNFPRVAFNGAGSFFAPGNVPAVVPGVTPDSRLPGFPQPPIAIAPLPTRGMKPTRLVPEGLQRIGVQQSVEKVSPAGRRPTPAPTAGGSASYAGLRLNVSTEGAGRVTPDLTDRPIEPGSPIILMAEPAPGHEFAGWRGDSSTAPEIRFVMSESRNLTAVFRPHTSPFVAGRYNGLIHGESALASGQSGYFEIDVMADASFRGSLRIGAVKASLNGRFDAQGEGRQVFERNNMTPIVLAFRIDPSGKSDRLVGSMTGDGTTIHLGGFRSDLSGLTASVSPGKYTMIIPSPKDARNSPVGDGFGKIEILPSGAVLFTGELPDGTAIRQQSFVSRSGVWPLSIPLYGGRGVLTGWIVAAKDEKLDLYGDLRWIKPADPADKYFPKGFASRRFAFGSTYDPTAASTRPHVSAKFHGGGLSEPLAMNLPVQTDYNSGVMTGTFQHPLTGQTLQFRGITVQKSNWRSGYFLGTNQSGVVHLTAAH
jgi:outer membrane protein assembly factor BamB